MAKEVIIRKNSVNNYMEKLINSILIPKFLFDYVISEKDYEYFFNIKEEKSFSVKIFQKIKRRMEKLFRFWPRIINHFAEDKVSHENYLEMEDTAKMLIDTIDDYCSTDMKFLDWGCNCGRHINELYNRGYSNLFGVDLSKRAIKVFREVRSNVFRSCSIKNDFFQRYLKRSGEKKFDTIYSHGATIELVHPSFDIIREICRVTKYYIILFINEHEHGFPRFYIWEFKKNGFYMVKGIRPVGQNCSGKNNENPNSLLVFKRLED